MRGGSSPLSYPLAAFAALFKTSAFSAPPPPGDNISGSGPGREFSDTFLDYLKWSDDRYDCDVTILHTETLSGIRKVAEMPESRDTVHSGLPDTTEILLDLRVNKF